MDEPGQVTQPQATEPVANGVPQVLAPAHAVASPGNGLAVAGMILGITSVIFCWWGLFSLAQWVLAITFSAIGIGHANRGAAHKGMATAGLVLGIIGAIFYFLIGIFSFGAGFFI